MNADAIEFPIALLCNRVAKGAKILVDLDRDGLFAKSYFYVRKGLLERASLIDSAGHCYEMNDVRSHGIAWKHVFRFGAIVGLLGFLVEIVTRSYPVVVTFQLRKDKELTLSECRDLLIAYLESTASEYTHAPVEEIGARLRKQSNVRGLIRKIYVD